MESGLGRDGGEPVRPVLSTLFLLGLLGHYLTGVGGPLLLAVVMVPVALALAFSAEAAAGRMHRVTAAGFAGLALVAAVYLTLEFEAIRIARVGIWTVADHLAGGVIAMLVLEYGRRRYYALFVLVVVLLVYAFTGPLWPGAFGHGGIAPARAAALLSLEMGTGVFDRLAQLGLTLIGAFILVLAVLRAFGAIDAVLRLTAGFTAKRPSLLPLGAVTGSFAVAAVSGSGAANVATTGAATIPAMVRGGMPRVQAAAVETAASLGGQLMPPLMGIAAFMMAELMGVGYFDVAARGFAPALVYFTAVGFAVYLLSLRYHTAAIQPFKNAPEPGDRLRVGAYAGAVVALVVLMGVQRQAPMTAAVTVFLGLLLLFGFEHFVRRRNGLLLRLRQLADTFATVTAELTVLLALLGMLTAVFTVTGVPTKVGTLVMHAAAIHPALMVAAAAAFGLVVGMGLPAAPTYVIMAVVVTPFMVAAGIDPWVAHFFAFLVAVAGELTPPTSVAAAVAARIADAPFLGTMFASLRLCLPLLLMIGAVFTRPELVLEPGLAQLGAWLLVTTGAIGMSVALHNPHASGEPTSGLLRWLVGVTAALAIFHPAVAIAGAAAVVCAAAVIFSWRRLGVVV